jgi:hypothetical protein
MMLGCSTTTPVKMRWPAVPAELTAPVNDLAPLPEDKKTLTDLLENANQNYSQYYILKQKFEAWQEWYRVQKSIFEDAQ